jgi:imidazolonepropionase-like amidohydrolase
VLAITGVTVIDPSSTARLLTQRTILIVDGRIRAVGPAARVRIPRGARVVRAMGKYAIPGLWDMHVHFMNTGSSALPLLVAHGVTSVREMGGFLDSTRAWQARMAAGTLVGPRIITPGPILESPQYLDGVRRRDAALGGRLAPRVLPYRVGVATPDDARAVIEMLVRQRVDFAKIRTAASPEAYFAILREARRAGLPVAGHAPGVASLVEASDSGQKSIEHAFAPPLNRLTSGERDALYVNLARKGTWYTPTLVVSRAVGVAGDSAERAIFGDSASRLDPRRPYASRWLLGWWRMQVDERLADTSSTRGAALRDAYESSLEDVRRMHVAGVRILAGTDAGSVLVYPGFSLHEELRLLVEGARLRPRDALWSATMGPARYLGLERSTGSIAAGKVADIVLLDRNPLANIRNTTRIFAVVKGGRVFTRSQLDALLAEVRVAAGS